MRASLMDLDPQGSATMLVSGTGLDELDTSDDSCTGSLETGWTCVVSNGAAASITFDGSPDAGGVGLVTFSVAPDGPGVDPDLSDNSVTVQLGPATGPRAAVDLGDLPQRRLRLDA